MILDVSVDDRCCGTGAKIADCPFSFFLLMIAISYRRDDSLPIAGRLYDRLQAKFGKKNVFMDFDSIPPGTDFREQIKKVIGQSDVVVAIIGPHWLGERRDGSRRIDAPIDFVRLEIAYALEANIPVIPLLVDATQMPTPEMLPPDIQELAFRHALPLDSGMDFHSHTDRLIAGIPRAVGSSPRSNRLRASSASTSTVNTTAVRQIVIWSAATLLAVGVSVIVFFAAQRPERTTTEHTEPSPTRKSVNGVPTGGSTTLSVTPQTGFGLLSE